MTKVWVLDTETKGTGANVVPLEKVLREPAKGEPAPRPRKPPAPPARGPGRVRPASAKPAQRAETRSPLPAGHVRKKATGEIGRIRALDPKAGTASVQWLKQGRTSTVPLTAITRR